ncbi:hypothetical protein M271_49030 [Streptomyces rapamycinicus NRRL 5491]|nr:hypothetical protein M271_49030 [Streptomyces rapamycinicus NRRL 5491]
MTTLSPGLTMERIEAARPAVPPWVIRMSAAETGAWVVAASFPASASRRAGSPSSGE